MQCCLVSTGLVVFELKEEQISTRENPERRGASVQPDYRGPIWLITLSINLQGGTARTGVGGRDLTLTFDNDPTLLL